MRKQDTANRASLPDEPFRLLDLPAEIRLYIYQFVLPHNLTIFFKARGKNEQGSRQWSARGSSSSGDPTPYIIGCQFVLHYYNPRKHLSCRPSGQGRWVRVDNSEECRKHPCVETQVFLLNKFTSNETRAVLYGSNTYRFTVDSEAHFPLSLRSPDIFGPFGDNIRLPLLRNLRSIHIDVTLTCSFSETEDGIYTTAYSHWVGKRQRSRLENFVELLKEYADDENRKSLLQELKVEMKAGMRNNILLMFCLESLISLRGIRNVEIIGLPKWYAKSLQLCIQGKGGDVQEVDWPLVQVKRRRRCRVSGITSTKKEWVTTRKWYQPTLNWKEYAERNGIPTPEDVDNLWVVDK
ncbi:uncharacterized protein K460DRAFT_378575 [Cucurbitaria berberidis CBS 394.84]|uniref:Uncharacterized protein n=1 Tax=Cucurbitaria berberidis CBS 394.84 TaxID=1168544 RepID=A0A9P4GD69_9PLEO|nr:uncharacterized protein K460DRAFT_378575 [Cucurbitaria berberidis CBS 394.84]KAF1843420.1 hypothetical protein K460DRAFT_378575 [Cucurbitaria berberidis CBS 394.84]